MMQRYLLSLSIFILQMRFHLCGCLGEANGLFDKVRILVLIRSGFNILLSIVFGLLGVYLEYS